MTSLPAHEVEGRLRKMKILEGRSVFLKYQKKAIKTLFKTYPALYSLNIEDFNSFGPDSPIPSDIEDCVDMPRYKLHGSRPKNDSFLNGRKDSGADVDFDGDGDPPKPVQSTAGRVPRTKRTLSDMTTETISFGGHKASEDENIDVSTMISSLIPTKTPPSVTTSSPQPCIPSELSPLTLTSPLCGDFTYFKCAAPSRIKFPRPSPRTNLKSRPTFQSFIHDFGIQCTNIPPSFQESRKSVYPLSSDFDCLRDKYKVIEVMVGRERHFSLPRKSWERDVHERESLETTIDVLRRRIRELEEVKK
ncbi:hypothetical protein BC830DRAFT_1093367 [Chytriomyces sp. MP71]|nr:hypothetical protein BC830DRAFT_1093367 [Chytriomyces sp. MP71]